MDNIPTTDLEIRYRRYQAKRFWGNTILRLIVFAVIIRFLGWKWQILTTDSAMTIGVSFALILSMHLFASANSQMQNDTDLQSYPELNEEE